MSRKAIIAAASACALAGAAALLWRAYGPSTYLRFDTMFGKTRVYQVQGDDGEPVRLLEVGGIVQSGTFLGERYTELVFEYLKRYDTMFEAGLPITRVCVLGCGGYDYPEHLIAHRAPVIVDAVEIDPAITAIARRYFHLDRLIEEFDTQETGRLNLICDDALHYLQTTEQVYDAIVNDTFDAGEPDPGLATVEAARAIRGRLVPGGLYLTNIVASLEGPRCAFLHDQVTLLSKVFAHVHVLPCGADGLADEDNVVVIATDTVLPEASCRPIRRH